MAKFTFEDMQRRWKQQDRARHKNLLINCGAKAFYTIENELPKGITLGEYLEELYAEIRAEKLSNKILKVY